VTAATASKTASTPNTAARPYVFLNPGSHGMKRATGSRLMPVAMPKPDAREFVGNTSDIKNLRHKNLHGVVSDLIAKDHWEAGDKQLSVAVHFDKEDGHDSRTDEAVIGVTFRPSRRGFEPMLPL
jgi:hypothetical protein